MSRPNVEQSVDAVERALSHFVASLERAGFAASADTYRQMSEIVLGQWLWVEDAGERDLEPRFLRIAELAEEVSGHLRPYVEVMERMSALRSLVAERWGVEPGTDRARIVAALVGAGAPMSAAEVREATSLPTAAVRRELDDLIDRDLVAKLGGGRPRYAIAAASATRAEES